MAAYFVGQVRIKDPEKWEAYRNGVGTTIAQFEGEVMFREELEQETDGQSCFEMVIVLCFRDESKATAWHESPDHWKLIPEGDAMGYFKRIKYR